MFHFSNRSCHGPKPLISSWIEEILGRQDLLKPPSLQPVISSNVKILSETPKRITYSSENRPKPTSFRESALSLQPFVVAIDTTRRLWDHSQHSVQYSIQPILHIPQVTQHPDPRNFTTKSSHRWWTDQPGSQIHHAGRNDWQATSWDIHKTLFPLSQKQRD